MGFPDIPVGQEYTCNAGDPPWFREDKGEVRKDQLRANRGEGDLGPAPAAGEAVRAPYNVAG